MKDKRAAKRMVRKKRLQGISKAKKRIPQKLYHVCKIEQYVNKLEINETNSEVILGAALEELVAPMPKIKVHRQKMIYPYIADFFIYNRGLVIEADGGIHNKRIEYDARRDRYLESLGLLVLRISNYTIENHLPEVIKLIKNAIRQRKNYKPSTKFKLNVLESSPIRLSKKGKRLIENKRKELKRHKEYISGKEFNPALRGHKY